MDSLEERIHNLEVKQHSIKETVENHSSLHKGHSQELKQITLDIRELVISSKHMLNTQKEQCERVRKLEQFYFRVLGGAGALSAIYALYDHLHNIS